MRYIGFCIFLLVFHSSWTVNAQVGIKMGMHSFDVSAPKDILFEDDKLQYRESELGFQGGLFARIDLKAVFLEPRIMFHSTKVEYTLDGESGSLGDAIRSETFTNLDIPVLIGFDLLFLDVFMGPVAHIHLDSASDLVDFEGYESKFDSATYGWRAGIGFGIGDIDLSVEYEGNFSSFGNHINIGGERFDFGDTPSRILVNLGVAVF